MVSENCTQLPIRPTSRSVIVLHQKDSKSMRERGKCDDFDWFYAVCREEAVIHTSPSDWN